MTVIPTEVFDRDVMFRISLGTASCRGHESRPPPERALCERVLDKIEWLKGLSSSQLTSLRDQDCEDAYLDGKRGIITTYRQDLPNGYLFVVQGFLPTFRFPAFFSASGIGKLFVEGLVLHQDGRIEPAAAALLGPYR